MTNFISKLTHKLAPPLLVVGLELNDSAVRVLDLKRQKSAFYRLPPGLIEGGMIKDRVGLAGILKQVYKQVAPRRRRPMSAILSLPLNNVYLQALSLPRVVEENLAEAVDLNLKMISPIAVEQAYYDWQELGAKSAENQIELLGAFVSRGVVDDFVGVLEEGGFGTAAVEFKSLSFTRELLAQKIITPTESYLVVEMAAEGLNFILVDFSSPIFHYFYPWRLIQGEARTINIDDFKRVLEEETRRIINFYATHRSGGGISELIFLSSVLGEEITSLASSKFGNLKSRLLEGETVSAASGAARRGLLPRGADFEISLSNLSAREVFEHSQLINFLGVWRNLALTLVGFLLILFSASDFFLRRTGAEVAREQGLSLAESDIVELTELKQKVEEFNRLVSFVGEINSSEKDLGPLIEKVTDLAGSEITISRFTFPGAGRPITVNGIATSENAAIDFKNQIAAQPQFSEVSLPLSAITQTSEGQVFFTISFKVNSLAF